MIKAYVINMDRNPERLRSMKDQFDRLGIPFERFPALDARQISDEQFYEFVSRRPMKNSGDSLSGGGREWSKPKMGCFLSHNRLWLTASKSTERFTAIFEDDLHVSSSLKHLLQSDTWIPRDCGWVRLEPSYNRIKMASRVWTTIAGRRLFRVIPSGYEHGWPLCTGGYIISRDTARQLLETPESFHTFTDVFVFNKLESPVAENIQVGQLDPAPCIQDKFLHRERRNIVFESEIDVAPISRQYSPLGTLGKKLRTMRLIVCGHRRVAYAS
jgi:glycosyl transferase family 25